MTTIKTCDRCGKIIDNKDVYLSGFFNSLIQEKGTNGRISDDFDLCLDCCHDFMHSYLKYYEMISLEEAKKDADSD